MAKPKLREEDFRILVRDAAAGSASAKRALVEHTLPIAHGMLVRLVGRRHEVDDLVQNVYARVFRSLATFRGDAAFTTWLCTICVNVAASFWKARKTNEEALAQVPRFALVDAQDTEETLMARQGLREVAAVMDGLSPTLRASFVLHVLEGHDVETVAVMTSSTVAATYKAIERARKHIENAAANNPLLSAYLKGKRRAP